MQYDKHIFHQLHDVLLIILHICMICKMHFNDCFPICANYFILYTNNINLICTSSPLPNMQWGILVIFCSIPRINHFTPLDRNHIYNIIQVEQKRQSFADHLLPKSIVFFNTVHDITEQFYFVFKLVFVFVCISPQAFYSHQRIFVQTIGFMHNPLTFPYHCLHQKHYYNKLTDNFNLF